MQNGHSSPSSQRKTGEGAGSPAAANPAAPGSGGGRGPGAREEGGTVNRSPVSPRAKVARRGGATEAGGGGREWLRRRRCGLGGGARAGECGCGDGRGARGLFYSRAKAVEVGGGSARLAGGSNSGRLR